jgi:hypothetical protein
MLTFRYTNLLPLHMTRPTTTWHLQESTRAGPASCNTHYSRVMNEHPLDWKYNTVIVFKNIFAKCVNNH